MKTAISTIAQFLFLLFLSSAGATPLYDYNTGSGTAWSGWTWFPNGADDFGAPGWRKDTGHWVSGNSNWMPRSHAKQDYGNSNLAEIYTADRAPSTSSGGSLRVYDTGNSSIRQSSWWWINDTNFGTQGFADATTDRFSFYFKTNGLSSDPGLEGTEPDNYNIHFGTYLCWAGGGLDGAGCPIESNGNHYYHHMTVHDGVWMHVVLDRHPQHKRDTALEPSDNPAGSSHSYWASMNTFYLEITYSQPSNTYYLIDEMQFSTTTQPENDISISTVWVSYRPSTDRWEIAFEDTSFAGAYNDNAIGTYEIRYSASPITNANFSSATTITPLYHGYGSAGRVRRPNPNKLVAWTRFQLPSGFQSANSHVYFAIKDVSATANGDGHNAPSSNIKTIDYFTSPGSASIPAPPTQLQVQ